MTNTLIDYRNHHFEDEFKLKLPTIIEAIVERTIIYFAEILYPQLFELDPQQAYNRFLISAVNSGTNVSLGDAIQTFSKINHNFPFTVYNIGELISDRINESNNQRAALGLEYFSEVRSKVRTYPSRFEMLFLSFFNRALDYHGAYTLIGSESSSLTRLYTPVMFGDVEVQIPFDVNIKLSKGSLAYEFEEYLTQNKIWDLVHNVEINYYEYILDKVTIGLVDNMLVRIAGDKSIKIPGEFGINNVPDNLSVISTYPIIDQINIPTNSVISFQFSEPPIEESIKLKFNIEFDYNISLNGSIYSITPILPLVNGIKYEITVLKQASNADNVPMLEDYILTFYTI